ncbi:MAG: ABC transporter substrate-binding protein [Bacteroidales bacterium]|jgi:peptide/nickel transport system substrate-binding protein|nr:ABC transporter substrate-binding protein [Bacteroidales bacterium]
MNFKLNKSLLILAATVVLTCSCKNSSFEDKTVFRYNEVDAITSLDPAYTRNLSNINACHQLFNGLVQLDDRLNVKACCAKDWNISEDGKTYTFILRDDIYFHKHYLFGNDSTRKLVASDFVYSFNRIIDPAWASPGAWVLSNVNRLDNGNLDVSAPNDTILIINLSQAFSPFLGILSMKYCSVVPKEIIDYYGKDFRNNPIGTGPFKFKYWKEDEKLILVKNESYFEFDEDKQLPYLDAISISFIKDKQTVFLEFVKDNFEYMSGIDPAFMNEFLTSEGELNPKYSEKYYLLSEPYLNTEYIGFNLADSTNPLSDPIVRKAVNYALDKDKMLRHLRANIGTPGYYGFIPDGLPGHLTENIYEYNPNKAIELLKQSKFYNDGKFLEISIATTIEYSDLVGYIQNRFNIIGIPVKIDIYPPAVIKEMRASNKLQCFRGSWVADYPDAENYLSVFYSKNFSPNGPNYCHFSNPDFDMLYEQSLKESDVERRNILYQEMDRILMEEPPVIILYYDRVLRFVNKKVEGLGSNPINLLELKRVEIR